MREPDLPSTLASPRRAIVALTLLTGLAAAVVTLHDGAVAGVWTDAFGALLGALAGTYIGEHLTQYRERVAATRIAWLQMATIGLLVVAIVTWQALPAYCQLPVSFVMGAVIATAVVYIQRF